MKQEKNISLKNYILLAVILIITIVIVIYLFLLKNTYEENKLNTPILDECLLVINYNELNNYLVENSTAVIYVSVLNNKNIRLFENKFRNIINKNSLNNKILYLDLTNELNDKKIVNDITKKYGEEVLKVPSILIVEDKKVVSSYSISENNYNVKLLENFLEEEGVIND